MTKKILTCLTKLTLLLALTSCSSSALKMSEPQLPYSSASLKLMDLDQMSFIVQDKIQRYKKTSNVEYIKEAITLSLSRPNEDGLAEKLLDTVRFSLDSSDLWEKALEAVVQKSISELKVETLASSDQITYLILLNNLISEFRPQFVKQYQSPKFESRIIESIAEANILVSNPAIAEGRLYLMKEPQSPSTLAQALLNQRNQALNPKK